MLFRQIMGTRTPLELLEDKFTLLLPARTFDLLLGALQFWGKPLLLINLTLSDASGERISLAQQIRIDNTP